MSEHPLRPMFNPQSIAVVGASPRDPSIGLTTYTQTLSGGFEGPIYPVNPRYESILGNPCFPSLADLPARAELVILAVGNANVEQQLKAAIEQGAGAVAIFASCYLEGDTPPLLTERLRRIASDARLPVCGANSLGFANLETGVRSTWFTHGTLRPGPIALISHSGSAYYALTGVDPRMRYNLVVSPGQELATSAADYLDYALELESTRAVGIFLETVRNPPAFRRALDKSRDRDIPVVVIKVGRTDLSAKLAQSHSGALAGNDSAYEALFEHYGVTRVHNIDEFSATLQLLSQPKKVGRGGLGAVFDSGGQRELAVDIAADLGVPFAGISAATTDKLKAALAYGLPAVNPVDAWSGMENFEQIFGDCLRALDADEATALTILFSDASGDDESSIKFRNLALEVAKTSHKPVGFGLNWSRQSAFETMVSDVEAGLPIMDGIQNVIAAVKHAFDRRDFGVRPAVSLPEAPSEDVVESWRERLRAAVKLSEGEGAELLRDFGIRTPVQREVGAEQDLLDAADEVGFPLVLKTAEGHAHKSDVGGVFLGIDQPARLVECYRELASTLGPNVLVAEMIEPGVELALGVVNDPQFGPLVMVGAGGVLIEVIDDRRFLLPPFGRCTAARGIADLTVNRLLDGVRGRAPADRESLYDTVSRFSLLAHLLGEDLMEVDVNPLICGPQGAIAVDALVIARARD